MGDHESYEVREGWRAEEHECEAEFVTFVQVARGFTYAGSMLDLVDLAPVTTIYGSPDAHTSLGHVTTSGFLELWWKASEPPLNAVERAAVLSLVDPSQEPWGDAGLRLSKPRIYGSGLRYDVSLVNGALPPTSGACALFIAPAAPPPPRSLREHE